MLTFQLHYQLHFGDAIYISGDSDYFGNWSLHQAKRMKWNQVSQNSYIGTSLDYRYPYS